jgi:hypothetical protein
VLLSRVCIVKFKQYPNWSLPICTHMTNLYSDEPYCKIALLDDWQKVSKCPSFPANFNARDQCTMVSAVLWEQGKGWIVDNM